MSKITLEPNSSGAGTFSIVSPDSNTNRTLNLPDASGNIIAADASTGQFDSSNMPVGSVIQVVQHRTTDQSRFTGVTPIGTSDALAPGDGIEYTSFTFTPKFSNSKLLLQSTTILVGEDVNTLDAIALFATHGGNTIIGSTVNHSGNNHWANSYDTSFMSLNHLFDSWGTDTRPISIRFCSTGSPSDVIVVNDRTDGGSSKGFPNSREVAFTLMEIVG